MKYLEMIYKKRKEGRVRGKLIEGDGRISERREEREE